MFNNLIECVCACYDFCKDRDGQNLTSIVWHSGNDIVLPVPSVYNAWSLLPLATNSPLDGPQVGTSAGTSRCHLLIDTHCHSYSITNTHAHPEILYSFELDIRISYLPTSFSCVCKVNCPYGVFSRWSFMCHGCGLFGPEMCHMSGSTLQRQIKTGWRKRVRNSSSRVEVQCFQMVLANMLTTWRSSFLPWKMALFEQLSTLVVGYVVFLSE